MRVFLDTNVLVDLLDSSRENFMQAAIVFEAAKEGCLEVCISSQSITDCAYIARKKPSDVFRAALKRILPFVEILPVTKDHLSKALSSPCQDLKDAALAACAEDNLCEAIITSNVQHFKPHTNLIVHTPGEFVRMCD